jgi:hypothetical protein
LAFGVEVSISVEYLDAIWMLSNFLSVASDPIQLCGVTRHGFGIVLPFFFAWCFVLSILDLLTRHGFAARRCLPIYSFASLAFGVVPQTFILVDFLIRRSFFFFG